MTLEDFSLDVRFDCLLAISTEMMVVIDEENKDIVCASPCKAVIGWTVLQSNASVLHLCAVKLLMLNSRGVQNPLKMSDIGFLKAEPT